MLSDNSLGNTANFHPTRACLVEVEFITNSTVDSLFNTAPNRNAFRQRGGVLNKVVSRLDRETKLKSIDE